MAVRMQGLRQARVIPRRPPLARIASADSGQVSSAARSTVRASSARRCRSERSMRAA